MSLLDTSVNRKCRARVHHDRDRVTVSFSRNQLQAAGIDLGDTVDFETTDAGDITLHPTRKPRHSISEYVGLLDSPELDARALRDEWAEREPEFDEQWRAGS